MPGNPVAEEAVRNVLLGVMDPELGDNIVDLGMVRIIEIDTQSGDVDVTIALTTVGCPLRAQVMKDIKLRVASLPRVAEVRVHFGEMTTEQKKNVMARARFNARDNALDTDIPATIRIVAIAPGKGGVGKSSVTANLAAQLAQRGLTVGVLDADIGGFSIPRMLGVEGRVQGVKDEADRARLPRSEQLGVPLLGSIPLDPAVAAGGDAVSRPRSPRRTHRRPRLSPPWPKRIVTGPSRSSRCSPAPRRQFQSRRSAHPHAGAQAHGNLTDPTKRQRQGAPPAMSTTEVTTTPVINLTDHAAAKVAELLAQAGDDQLALRVAVRAGGCSGFSYEIFFDADTDPEDHEAVFGTVKVRVDPASALHIAGATLDYNDGLQDAGFHIENPNAQHSCGCGQSFA